jgi:hypothetical protein
MREEVFSYFYFNVRFKMQFQHLLTELYIKELKLSLELPLGVRD